MPLRGIIAVTPWLVFLTPSYLKALAWVLLMSSGGYLAQLGILPQSWSEAFFGLEGLVFVHTLGLFPLASFIIASALAGLGSELEDAARLSGSSPLKIWLRINGPLLAPAIALSVIATFAEVLSDFGLASTIARTSNFGVLTYGIYSATSDYPVDFCFGRRPGADPPGFGPARGGGRQDAAPPRRSPLDLWKSAASTPL